MTATEFTITFLIVNFMFDFLMLVELFNIKREMRRMERRFEIKEMDRK